MTPPTRVAILGGGMAGLTTAFELTRPELDGRFAVTVYTLDGLLGGKGASTRNERTGNRIEEHGLHVWFGFYDNAFDLMREVYGLHDGSRLLDHFIGCDELVLGEKRDRWVLHSYAPPPNDLELGEDVEIDYWEAVERTLDWVVGRWAKISLEHRRGIVRLLGALVGRLVRVFIPKLRVRPTVGIGDVLGDQSAALVAGVGALGARIARLTRPPRRRERPTPLADPRSLSNRITRLADGHLQRETESLRVPHARRPARAPHVARRLSARRLANDLPLGDTSHSQAVAQVLGRFLEWFQDRWIDPGKEKNDDVRLLFYTIDTLTAVLNGVVRDGLNEKGLATIDHRDFREWLFEHGASRETIDRAPFIRGLYDLVFGFRDGDPDRPDLAAGKALQACVRLAFGYKQNLAFKVQDGLGDAVFLPLYEVLKGQRGVEFRFFHDVRNLEVAEGKVTAITGRRPILERPYEPLHKGTWPSSPRWNLGPDDPGPAAEPPWEQFRLTRESFDEVVLAISGGCLEAVCQEVCAAVPQFAEMVSNTNTIATQAAQMWLTRSLADQGWPHGVNSVLSAYDVPLSTYAGMEHLVARERWPTEAGVKDIAYFCGVLKEDGESVAGDAERTIRAFAFLPPPAGALKGDSEPFDWTLLAGTGVGAARASEQYYRMNVEPAERYVTTHRGTVEHRLWPDQSGVENLKLAGDWTRCGIDGGCMEAAVASGRLAAHAISKRPRKVPGTTGWLGSEGEGRSNGTPLAAAASARAAYVDYGPLTTIPGPWRSDDTVLWGFWARADGAKLDALCRRVFAEPSQGAADFRALGDRVMITWGSIGSVRSLDPAYAERGSVRENQVAIWVPVVRIRETGGKQAAISLSWFVPYLWVDPVMSVTTGREVVGFSKADGEPTFPEPDGSGSCTLRALALARQGEQAARHLALEVNPLERGFDLGDTFESLLDTARAVRRALGELDGEPFSPSIDLVMDVIGDLAARRLNGVFLKQFPEVEGTQAALQQVVELAYTVRRFRAAPLLGRYELVVHELYSQPLEEELGLVSQQLGPAYRCEMDFDVHQGRILWPL
jgi:uncharacterized protein with NAD-binding domain and iron-sulfur cluster